MQNKLEKKLEKVNDLLEQEEVIDIYLFGSSVKGKLFPKDIDIFVIFTDNASTDLILKSETKLREKGFDPVCVKYKDLKLHSKLVSMVFQEGRSLKFKQSIVNLLNFKGFILYTYKHNLNSTGRTRFSRALKSIASLKFAGKGVLIVDTEESDDVERIFYKYEVNFVKLPSFVNEGFMNAFEKFLSN